MLMIALNSTLGQVYTCLEQDVVDVVGCSSAGIRSACLCPCGPLRIAQRDVRDCRVNLRNRKMDASGGKHICPWLHDLLRSAGQSTPLCREGLDN